MAPGRGSRSGRGQGLGSRLWSRSWVKVRGQGHGVKVRIMIGSHKVRDLGRWSRSGYRSWGQVGGGVKFGSRSGDQGQGGVKVVVKVRGQGRGVKVRVMIGGHKVGGQGRWSRSGYRSWGQVGEGSRLWVQVGGQVWEGVRVRGSRSGSR